MKLNDRTAYIVISEYAGVRIPMLCYGCTINDKKVVTLFYKERVRRLEIEKVLNVNDSEFEFIDTNNVKVHIHPVLARDFINYKEKNFLFIDAPDLNSDKEVQRWLIKQAL
jgi:hypothetical protein